MLGVCIPCSVAVCAHATCPVCGLIPSPFNTAPQLLLPPTLSQVLMPMLFADPSTVRPLLTSTTNRGRTPLHEAVCTGHLRVVQALLVAGGPSCGGVVDAVDEEQRTALVLALTVCRRPSERRGIVEVCNPFTLRTRVLLAPVVAV